MKQLVSYYPNDLAWATTADQIDEAFASGDDDDDESSSLMMILIIIIMKTMMGMLTTLMISSISS